MLHVGLVFRIAGWALVCCVAGMGSAGAGLAETDPAAAETVLMGYETKDHVSNFVGPTPSACIDSSATQEICEWELSGSDPGWRPLAKAIHSGDRLRLLCELPQDGSPRAHGSCSAHPQRSNRGEYKVSRGAGPRRLTRNQVEQRQAESQRRANSELAGAHDLPQLCRLLGALPDSCHETSAGSLICMWRTNSRTQGHGMTAALINADPAKRVRLQCELPLDGSRRPDGSCAAHVGS